MIQLVRQETPTECSLACAAMVSGRSLVDVRKIAKDLYHPNIGVYPSDFLTLLTRLNISYSVEIHPIDLDGTYIVAVESLNIAGGMHHIVMHDGHYLDPNNGRDGKRYYDDNSPPPFFHDPIKILGELK